MDFSVYNLHPLLLEALAAKQFVQATAVQQRVISPFLAKRDILAIAPTGTGKTESFAIPIIQQLLTLAQLPTSPSVLVLSPTRELALQTFERFEGLIQDMPLQATCIYGGKSYDSQLSALEQQPQIIVATPGRLIDLLDQQLIQLDQVQTLILDEADQLLDLGFLASIHLIKRALPANCQKALFSATFPERIAKLGEQLLVTPETINLTAESPKAAIEDYILFVDKVDKKKLIHFLLEEFALPQVLIFSRTTAAVDRIVADLNKHGIQAAGIYADKGQKVREQTLDDFRAARIQALVATDVAARGLDIPELKAIINYEIPDSFENYTHRIGRTGRAQQQGWAFTFCDAEDNPQFIQLQLSARKTFAIYDKHPYILSWEKMLSSSQRQSKGKKKLRK